MVNWLMRNTSRKGLSKQQFSFGAGNATLKLPKSVDVRRQRCRRMQHLETPAQINQALQHSSSRI